MLHVTGYVRTHNAASNGNAQTQGQLVLGRSRSGRGVLCGIAHDGEQDQTDELFRDPTTASQAINRINKPPGSDSHESSDDDEKSDGHRERQFGYFFLFVIHLGSFLVRDLPWITFGLAADDMSVAICRSHARTVLLDLFHAAKGKSKGFLGPGLSARPGADVIFG